MPKETTRPAGGELLSDPADEASLNLALNALSRLTGVVEIKKRKVWAAAGVIGSVAALAAGAGINESSAAAAPNQPLAANVPAVPMRDALTAAGNVAPAKWTGVLEDAAKQPSQSAADQKMQLVGDLVPPTIGNPDNVYVKESIWASAGQYAPNDEDFAKLENSIRAARVYGYHVCLAVWPYTWGAGPNHLSPPLTPSKRWQYTTLLATIDGRLKQDFNYQPGSDEPPPVGCWFIGNEPNNPTFWRPQFNPDGTDAAAAADEKLLARSYDTLKKIDPNYIVIGGELASHGNDDPHSKRPSHSPGAFIRDLGLAYRQSGRTKPIMDIMGFHPYGWNSAESPATVHTDPHMIGEADYPRLVKDLGQAFDGTAQAGSDLPILYSEYGDQSTTTGPQSYRYHHAEPRSSGAVDESQQAANYKTYLKLAACQPNVIGAFIFHTEDESDRRGWQSGVYYSDGAPKTSQLPVGAAMTRLSTGGVDCSGS